MDAVRILEVHASLASARLIEPCESLYTHIIRITMKIDGSEPLLDQLNALDRFRRSLGNAMLEALKAPAPRGYLAEPHASLTLEACDQDGEERHRLGILVDPDLDKKGAWWASTWIEKSAERKTSRPDLEDALAFVMGILAKHMSAWLSEVPFERLCRIQMEREARRRGR